MSAPIALFVYDRPDHLRRVIAALLNNPNVEEAELIVFSDAAKTLVQLERVTKVREYLQTITGFKSVTIHSRPMNFGLAKSIIEGVTQVLEIHESVIVLEDDLMVSPFFLQYMNDALSLYEKEEAVISIHGYNYPIKQKLPEAFFIPGADCWGWATWRRGWKLFNPDGAYLLQQLTDRNLSRSFDFNNSFPYTQMLKDQIQGLNNSWAIRWYASAFLHNKLTLYPRASLVQNIGNDGSGVHSGAYSTYDVRLTDGPVDLSNIKVQTSQPALQAFESFFRSSQPGFIRKVARFLKQRIIAGK